MPFYTSLKLSYLFWGRVLIFDVDGKCFFKVGAVEQKESSISWICGMNKCNNVPWNNISDSSDAEQWFQRKQEIGIISWTWGRIPNITKIPKFYETVAKNLSLSLFWVMFEFCSAVKSCCCKFVFSLMNADFDFFGKIVATQFSYSLESLLFCVSRSVHLTGMANRSTAEARGWFAGQTGGTESFPPFKAYTTRTAVRGEEGVSSAGPC